MHSQEPTCLCGGRTVPYEVGLSGRDAPAPKPSFRQNAFLLPARRIFAHAQISLLRTDVLSMTVRIEQLEVTFVIVVTHGWP